MMRTSARMATRVVTRVVIRDAACQRSEHAANPREPNRNTMTKASGTPLNKPCTQDAVTVEGDLEGGNRADGAAKGRGKQVNNGHSRSTTDTRKPALTRHATL